MASVGLTQERLKALAVLARNAHDKHAPYDPQMWHMPLEHYAAIARELHVAITGAAPSAECTESTWSGELCKRCGRRNCVGFQVSDSIWSAVVRGRWNVLCTACFDEEAELVNVTYCFDAVWPVSWSMWAEVEATPRVSAAPSVTSDSARGAVSRGLLRAALVALLAAGRLRTLLVVVGRRPARAVGAEVPSVSALLLAVFHLVSLVDASEPPTRHVARYCDVTPQGSWSPVHVGGWEQVCS
jgi:hypothetical protein